MKRTLILATVLFATIATTTTADAQGRGRNAEASSVSIPVVNALPGALFNGTFTIDRFVPAATGVAAVGTLAGVLTPTVGSPVSIFRTMTVPVSITEASCEVLHLDLGPLFVDLLGLQVDLSRVVLDVTAVPGAGNLLGNLLCAVSGLLDSPGGLARLLNQILSILG
jgi:hypothetical protein